ncbi:nuclear localization sequence-binding protein-like [Nicotiana sylvestris]|uniref:nuclear localization sequence-binding protein-like n=1 Tax=Nicotiana sylvestris TaxID=4096 RepID=UPI00388C5F36
MTHEGNDIFWECLAVIEEGLDPDASFILEEAKKLLKQAVSLHLPNQTELAWYEAELKKISEERDSLKILYVKKEGEISDLRVELTKFQSVKEESLARGREIEELKAKSIAELAKTKSDAEAIISSYRADAEEINAQAKEISSATEVKLSSALDQPGDGPGEKPSRRCMLAASISRPDIEKTKTSEEKAATFISNDEDSTSGSDSGKDKDEDPEDEAHEDAAAEGDTAPE